MFYRTNNSNFVMTVRVKDILSSLNNLAPFHLAEQWDNVGLLVGNPDQQVTAILIGLDPTDRLLDEAISLGANTIITHHPVIFKPLTRIDTSTAEGMLLAKALANSIALIGCHTNFDSARIGVSAILGEKLGLKTHRPLIPSPHGESPESGLGSIGSYDIPKSSTEFFAMARRVLGQENIRVAGPCPEKIATVAICGGSGSDFAPLAHSLGADVYISAEIKHSTAIWAIETGFCIIDGTHYATEKPAVSFLVNQLEEICRRQQWDIRIMETTTEYQPFVNIDRIHQQ